LGDGTVLGLRTNRSPKWRTQIYWEKHLWIKKTRSSEVTTGALADGYGTALGPFPTKTLAVVVQALLGVVAEIKPGRFHQRHLVKRQEFEASAALAHPLDFWKCGLRALLAPLLVTFTAVAVTALVTTLEPPSLDPEYEHADPREDRQQRHYLLGADVEHEESISVRSSWRQAPILTHRTDFVLALSLGEYDD
jgi:hypothetical protein